ncbi:hypothetical protein Moror_4273 [Moniliophthora roreri MCA 2997]|uniref:DUF6534 domain-containing protein n=1 Tax=Moniliophthora roreri (strain MCA 2997) TaxID=1381753 RepID=V2WUM7_MONRO|nr:hypothetical protein Moror_4273 [Moniliophthora roreri MCA 2997]
MSSPQHVFGPMLIGTLLDAILLGTLTLQVLSYFHKYPNDRWWFKCLVAYLMAADIANTVCDFTTVWEPLVQNYGKVLDHSPRLLPADAITTTLISTPVQLFMAWRIKIITRNKVIPCILAIMSAVSLGGGIWLSIGVVTETGVNFIQNSNIKHASYMWLITSTVTDVTITSIIMYVLISRRKIRSSISSPMDSHISRVLRLTVEAGTITALATCADVIVFLTVTAGPYFFIWDFTISKLYSNSLLASLNARPTKSTQPDTKAALFLEDTTLQSAKGRASASFHDGHEGPRRGVIPLTVHYQTSTIASFSSPEPTRIDPHERYRSNGTLPADMELGTIPPQSTKALYRLEE